MRRIRGYLCGTLLVLGFSIAVLAMGRAPVATGVEEKSAAPAEVKPQTVCPVMGGKINKDLYADVKGYRVYVCCPGCEQAIKQDPDKYLAKIRASGETPEKLTVVLCGKCGEVKGTDACCKEDAVKCGKCGLTKGAPGCCKMPKGESVTLCNGCGQIKGTPVCCAADAAKCEKCGKIKGAPGCCL